MNIMTVLPSIREENKWYVSFGAAWFLTLLSYFVALHNRWIDVHAFGLMNWLEVFAVFTGYACTILCNYQTRWNYPIGIACQIAYFTIFYVGGSPGLAFFNLYLVASLAYGFWFWRSDENSVPVSHVAFKEFSIYVIFAFGVLALFYGVLYYFDPLVFNNRLIHVDAAIAALSGVAQFLLDRKKIETWGVWVLVNLISIPYFFYIGFYFVAFQYIFFLANTFIGYSAWKKTMR